MSLTALIASKLTSIVHQNRSSMGSSMLGKGGTLIGVNCEIEDLSALLAADRCFQSLMFSLKRNASKSVSMCGWERKNNLHLFSNKSCYVFIKTFLLT